MKKFYKQTFAFATLVVGCAPFLGQFSTTLQQKTQGITTVRDPNTPVYVKELKNYEIASVDENTAAQFWVGTRKNGLYVSTSQNMNIYNKFKKVLNVPKIQAVKTDANNGVWVGTEEGLYYSPKGVTFAKVKVGTDPNASVDALMVDKDNNLWVGTQGEGLWKAPLGSKTFSSFPKFQNNYVLSLARGDGMILVGTIVGLYKTIDNDNFTFVKSLGTKIINAIYQEPAKKPQFGSKISGKTITLVGTEENGLWFSDYKTEYFMRVVPPASDAFVTTIAKIPTQDTYIGTNSQGLWYQPTTRLTTYKKVSFGSVQVKSILNLYRDAARDLWIGTGIGFYYIPSK